MIWIRLFIEFFKTGLFSIGGGLATIPFLKAMATNPDLNWFDEKLLGNMIAVGESTPGPIGVNMATYVGYTVGYDHGSVMGALFGSFLATFALVLPSVIIIIIVAKLLQAFKENKYIARSFYAIRPAVTGMIASAAVMMIKSGVFTNTGNFLEAINPKAAILFVALLFFTNKIKLHPIFYIVIAGAIGAIFSL